MPVYKKSQTFDDLFGNSKAAETREENPFEQAKPENDDDPFDFNLAKPVQPLLKKAQTEAPPATVKTDETFDIFARPKEPEQPPAQ